jgi:hypothetical protein
MLSLAAAVDIKSRYKIPSTEVDEDKAMGTNGTEQVTQRKILEVDKGLFLVRYESAEDKALPPKVTVTPAPDFSKSLSFTLHPDHDEAVLWRPGASLVLRTTMPAKFAIEVSPAHANGSSAATVRVEPLVQGEVPAGQVQARPEAGSSGGRGLSVLGHVANVGDVVVNPGAWLGGPSAPSRIEGIAIQWPDKPSNVDIRYSVRTAGADPNSVRPVTVGAFSGTRRKALPVVGLMLELYGARAGDFEFDVEAIFLGAPIMRTRGQCVVLSGPTGREPLVGLKIGLESAGGRAASASVAGQEADAVRVFRNRPRQDPAMTL